MSADSKSKDWRLGAVANYRHFVSNERCSFGGGGGVGACSFGRKIGIKFFFWLGSRSSPAVLAGRILRQCGPRLRHLAAASRGRDRPVWSWVFDVDTLTAFRRFTPAYLYRRTVKQWRAMCIHCAKWAWFCIALYLVSCRFSDRWRGRFKQPSRGGLQGQACLWRIVGGVWKSDPVLWVCRRLKFCRSSSQLASSCHRYQRGAGRVAEGAFESRWREAAHRRAQRDGAEGKVRVWIRWKVTISASPQPSSSSDRSASDRSPSSSASASSTSGANATVSAVRLSSALSSRKLVLPSASCVHSTSTTKSCSRQMCCSSRSFSQIFVKSWSAKIFSWVPICIWCMCSFGGGGGGSTQTNIVRLKQNVDNWRRPLRK